MLVVEVVAEVTVLVGVVVAVLVVSVVDIVVDVVVDIVVDVVVDVVVVEVAVTSGIGPNRRISPAWPTVQPSCEATIQTAFKSSFPAPARGCIGMGYTLVHVKPSQNSRIGAVPSSIPTAQPSLDETIYSEVKFCVEDKPLGMLCHPVASR